MKKKKFIVIGSFILFLIGVTILFLFMMNKISSEDVEENNISVTVNDAEVSIFEVTDDTKNFEVKEETDNYGNVKISIEDDIIEDQLGTNKILKQSYFKLDDNYYLLEILISKKGTTDILSDAELSLSYDYCYQYAKIWYIYNKNTKEKYIFEDNLKSGGLSLNPKITEDDLGTYFEFDKMFNFSIRTDVDHYKIDIDTLISYAESNNQIDFSNFSTINVPIFTDENLTYEIEDNKDINGDGKEDYISLSIFDDKYDLNKLGYTLKINDCVYSEKNVSTIPSINYIDLDKNDKFKEILILSYDENEPSVQTFKILYYDGTNIKFVFNGLIEDNVFSVGNEINELDFSLNDEDVLTLSTSISDTVQNWNIDKKYALSNNHTL